MKYLEELTCGECFEYNNSYYIVTHDFKKNRDRLCIKLDSGFSQWFQSSSMVNTTDIFTMDKDNNIIAIKERLKDNVTNQNQDIS